MPSFVDALNKIKTLLEGSQELQDALNAPAGKLINVRLAWKRREEINLDELPIALITRPDVEGRPGHNAMGLSKHTVLVYLGFYCEDREAGVAKLIQVDEAVERLIMADPTLGGLVDYVSPSSSQNDEGKNHPAYFFVKSFDVHCEISYVGAV